MEAVLEQKYLTLEPNEQVGRFNDTITLVAEALEGSMRTSVEAYYDGHDLISRSEGTAFKGMFQKSLDEAEYIAQAKPQLAFELRRRRLEYGEYEDMLDMMKGQAPNTMVVISDFPEEIMHSSKDVGGYNVRRKQTMLRVITRQEDNSLRIITQSLDRSDRQGLEAICMELGSVPKPGELLGQRIKLDLAQEDQQIIVDRLTSVYDKVLSDREGGKWQAGRRVINNIQINTYDFALDNRALIEQYTCSSHYGNERFALGLLKELKDRFEMGLEPAAAVGSLAVRSQVQANQAEHVLWEAAARAEAQGEVFNACGATISGGGVNNSGDELLSLGYGNKTKKESKYSFDKLAYCIVCQKPPKEKESKKMCGPCDICRSCDPKA